EWLALAVLMPVLPSWLSEDDKVPAVVTVVKRIGRNVGATAADTLPVGNQLLAIAEQAGEIELRSDVLPGSVDRRDALRVYPSDATRAELAMIYAQLAGAPELYPQPIKTRPAR